MRSLIDDTPQLQYKVELYLAGIVEMRFTEGDIHGALSKLRLQEEAWSRFQPLQEFDVPSSAGRPVKRNILVDNARHSATFTNYRRSLCGSCHFDGHSTLTLLFMGYMYIQKIIYSLQ